LWEIDHEQSELGLVVNYFGSDMPGKFEKFSALILFDPENYEKGYFNVDIDVTSAKTSVTDSDELLVDSE